MLQVPYIILIAVNILVSLTSRREVYQQLSVIGAYINTNNNKCSSKITKIELSNLVKL